MTLTDFLLARIAEDEAEARQVARGDAWHIDGDWRDDRTELVGGGKILAAFTDEDRMAPHHVATWSPARVLAECEAKRRIVEWHKSWPVLVEGPPKFESNHGDDISRMTMRVSKQIAWTTEQAYRDHFGSEPPTGPVLRLLALPYADHQDYRGLDHPEDPKLPSDRVRELSAHPAQRPFPRPEQQDGGVQGM